MRIKNLQFAIDAYAMKSAQRRTFSRHPRKIKMTENAFTKRARELREGKPEQSTSTVAKKKSSNGEKTTKGDTMKNDKHRSTKKSSKKTSAKKSTERKQRESRASESDLGKITKMYNSGKTVSEISDSMGYTDKKSNWPYSYTYGLLKRLRADKKVKAKR
jgi:hypothetical protein